MAGLEIPNTVDGQSLFPIIKGEDKTGREQAVCAYKSQQRAIKKDEYKLLTYQVDGRQPVQLFNMEEDPWEMNNLANNQEFQSLLKELKSDLMQGLAEIGDSAKISESDWDIAPILPWVEKLN
nr:sulfatase/phosphatase domain-containing protein [Flexithrix dorotheae]